MQQYHNDNLDINKILFVLKKRKWLLLICLTGILIPIIIFNHVTIPTYQANTTIVFEEQKGAANSLTPFGMTMQPTRSFIINQIEEIKSRSLAEEVVQSLPPGIIKTFPLPESPGQNFKQTDYIARLIQQKISAISVPNSEIIKIHVEAYSPIAAKVIANTIAEVLKQRNLEVRREETSNVRQIIEDQLAIFKKQLDDAELTLKEFKERSNVTVIERETDEILKRITEAEVSYNQTKADLDAANKRLTYIQQKLKKERKDLVPTITEITSPWAQKLKEQLVDLEVRYTTLKVQNYAEDHPKMVELQKQIKQTKLNLKEESLKIAAGENIVDPISQIQHYMEESIALEIEIQTYNAQERALNKVINQYKRNLSTMPDKELRLAQLLRDKEVNEKIYTMLLNKREEAKIAEAERVGNIRIIDPAKMQQSPIKPKKALNLVIGIILGLSLGIGFVIISELLNNSINSIDEVENLTQLSVLGTIPKIRANVKNGSMYSTLFKNGSPKLPEMSSRLIAKYNPKSPESEAFRTLRTNLQFSSLDLPLKTIVITSSNPGEGKSLITSNLSITTAQMGLKTLLIDADLRKPVVHSLFELKREPGIINILTSSYSYTHKTVTEPADVEVDNNQEDTHDIDDLLKTNINSEIDNEALFKSIKETIRKTSINNLDVLTCGIIPPNPSEILTSKAMKNIFQLLKRKYDAIFIDTPPINVVTDAGILGNIADGTIIILKAGKTTKNDIRRSKSLLQKANSKIVGTVMNHMDSYHGYYNYYYYFDSNSGEKVKKKRNLVSIFNTNQ